MKYIAAALVVIALIAAPLIAEAKNLPVGITPVAGFACVAFLILVFQKETPDAP